MFQGPLRIPFIRKRNVKLILTSVFPMSISSRVAEPSPNTAAAVTAAVLMGLDAAEVTNTSTYILRR